MVFWTIIAIAYLICGAVRLIGDFSGDPEVNPGYVRLGFGNLYTLKAMLLWWRGLPPFAGFYSVAFTTTVIGLIYWGLGFLISGRDVRFAILLAIPAFLVVIAATRQLSRG